MSNKQEVVEYFYQLRNHRQSYKLSTRMNAHLTYCEYVLQSKLVKSKKTLKQKTFKSELHLQFCEAYKSLSLDQKLSYYIRIVKMIQNIMNNNIERPQCPAGILFDFGYIRSFSLKIWKQKNLRLNREQKILYAEYEKQIKAYSLHDYMMRQSKNTDYHSFVLEAINKNPTQKEQTVHIGFKDKQKLKIWLDELTALYSVVEWHFVKSQLKDIFQSLHSPDISPYQLTAYKSNEKQNNLMKNCSQIYEKTNLHIKPEIDMFPENLEETIKMSKSVLISKQEKVKAMSFDIQEYYSIQASNPSNHGFTSLGTLNNELDYFADTQRAEYQQNLENIPEKIEEEQQENINGDSPLLKKNTLIESLACIDVEDIEQIQEYDEFPEDGFRDNIFNKIFPEYDLSEVESSINFHAIEKKNNLRIFQHLQKPEKIKFSLDIHTALFSLEEILIALTNPEITQLINPQIESNSVKTMIKSENSAMIYKKIKPYSKFYRARDFIYLRHVFQINDIFYVAEKSVESINYPPFTTIVRGELLFVWSLKQIQNKEEQNEHHFVLLCDVRMKNNGYLSQKQDLNLLVKYFLGFEGLQERLKQHKNKLHEVFISDWKIFLPQKGRSTSISKVNTQKANNSPHKAITFTTINQKLNDLFKTQEKENAQTCLHLSTNHRIEEEQMKTVREQLQNSNEKQKEEVIHIQNDKTEDIEQKVQEEDAGQIPLEEVLMAEKMIEQIKTLSEIKRDFDQNGMVVISNNFVKTKYHLEPLPKKQPLYEKDIHGNHPIWKGDWKHDTKQGGIIFINQKKIEDQKGVLKFILSNIGKNLLAGKSVMNISLPVDIFSAQSNLQLFMYSFTYASLKIQPVATPLDQALERFKGVVAFGISNSPLYLNMEKPFNPILGQTFQCFIDGCPGYAQQISHHPPIAALYLQGRGYKLTGQFQSKVDLHVNSGCGINDGVFTIEFDDGMKICYMTPGGEVSGLAYGDRKFNMVGKSYYWSESEGLFVELIFNPTQKGFFSVGKQQKPIDYFQGMAVKVKPYFFKKFLKKRKGQPQEKEIIERIGKIHGIWHKVVKFEDEVILDIDKQYPIKLEYEANPLPSDANWREDIAYRRILEITRSQTEKERLEILQRKDRKLREQLGPKKH